jgi:hypothetical protein
LNLIFKIILIQKFQISISRKGLNLFEFESVFHLDSNLGFKNNNMLYRNCETFSVLTMAQNRFWPISLGSTIWILPLFLLFYRTGQTTFGPSFFSSITMRPPADALCVVAALSNWSTSHVPWSQACEE